MASKEALEKIEEGKQVIAENGITYDYCLAFLQIGRYLAVQDKDFAKAEEIFRYAKEITEEFCVNSGGTIWEAIAIADNEGKKYPTIELWYEICKELAPYDFECYLIYMERNRPYKKRFYPQRRKVLNIVVKDLEKLEKGEYKFYGLSMPSRVGKTSICIFFLSWVMLKRPNSHSAMGGHSGSLARGFYSELLELITSADYCFAELFELSHPGRTCLQDKSAEEYTINLDTPDRFKTFTARGIDGTWTGAIDISQDGYLYVDDLIRDREHSLSPNRMENTYQEYLNKMCDRKAGDGCRELMVGTRWNVNDPLGRIEEQYKDNPQYFFRKIPAIDENGESNFKYEFSPFSTQYFLDTKERLDEAEWCAKFMQKPFVREGLILPENQLRYFNGILPEGDGRIVAVVDVALGGGDSLSMPIGKEYENGDVYVFDWIFNNGVKEITMPLVTGAIMRNEIRQIRFEANQGGDLYCKWVDELLRNQGYACSCTHKRAPNNMEKMAKIEAYSGDIKRKFVFLTPNKLSQEQIESDRQNGVTRYVRSKEYQKAIDEMTTTVSIGKNTHDDAIDGITQLAMYVAKPLGIHTTRIISSPI